MLLKTFWPSTMVGPTAPCDEAARAAAVALGSDRQYENQHIMLVTDIRTVFHRYDKDRLRTKAELIPALAGLEDSPWGEWTGLDGNPGHGIRGEDRAR